MAYKKIRQEQADFLKQKENEKKLNDELIKDYKELRNLGKELLPHQEKRLKNLQKEQALATGTVDLEKKLNKQSQSLNQKKQKSADLGKIQVANLKKDLQTGKTSIDQFKSQVAVVEQIATGQASSVEIQQALNDLGEDATEGMKKYLKQAQRTAKANEMSKDFLSQSDNILGGLGGKITGFLTNPLTLATAALLAFNAQQEAIAKDFGAIGVTEFREELAGASQEFAKIGLEANEALSSTKAISAEFGISLDNSIALADSVGDLAVSTGLAVSDSAKLVGLFTEIGGLTEKGALELAKQAESLAVANGVAPNLILKDIADNAETFAKFSSAGADGLTRAAIQARKLGIEFADVASAAEKSLDFSSSLNAEVEASVLLGRNLNLQKARELALTGDLEGFQGEILKQVGSQAQFDKMNVLQKKALAEATGLTVQQLSKMVSKEKEAVTLQGALGKQKIEDMVPEKTITNVANLIGQFKALGMQLAESFGPIVNMILSAFVGLANATEKTVGLGPGLLGMYTALSIAKKKDTILTIRNAVAKFFGAAGDMSLKTMGFGTIAAVAMAAGAVATMLGTLATIAVGDFEMKANQNPTFTTSEGQKFSFSKNDDVLAAPGLSAAVNGMSGGGATIINTDTSKIEKKADETNSLLTELIGTVKKSAKDTGIAAGRAVIDSV